MQDSIVIKLDDEDNNRTYKVDRDYSHISINKLSTILNKMFNPEFNIYYDDENRFVIYTRPMKSFTIIEMTYNFQILTGTLQTKFPIKSITKHSWIAPNKRYLDIGEDEYLESGSFILGTNDYGGGFTLSYSGERIKLNTFTDFKVQTMLRKMLDDRGLNNISIRYTNRYNHDKNDPYEYLVLLRDNAGLLIHYMSPALAKLIGSPIQVIEKGEIWEYIPPIPSTTKSGVHYYRSDSVGIFNLTPVLYLTSNLGSTCYSNGIDSQGNLILDDRKIVMRINNYFINGLPIIANNIEFTSTVPSGALTNVWFRLVDSNYQPVKLLTPMEISIAVIGIDEKPIQLPIYHGN
jgi:hypothetical protein